MHQTSGKTRSGLRAITLDDTTLAVLAGWQAHRTAEFAAVGIATRSAGCSRTATANTSIPVCEAFRRIFHNAGVPTIRFHDRRHTHGSPLIKDDIPGQVVSERLGHANIAFTMQTYQHVLPGMQTDAAHPTERLADPLPEARRRQVRPSGRSMADRSSGNEPLDARGSRTCASGHTGRPRRFWTR